MSRTRMEKLAESLPPKDRENIRDQYDRIERVEHLNRGDRIEVETSNDVSFTATVSDPIANPDKDENHSVALDVNEYDGPDWQRDSVALIVVDYEGANGSLGPWTGVPYTTAMPAAIAKDTWGDIETMEVIEDE